MISLRCSPRSFWSENAILITLKTPCGIDVVLPTLPPRMVFSHILLSFSYPHRPLEIDTISNFLCELPIEEAAAWLNRFEGVGPKTTACVLLFSCELPQLPVDVH